MAFGSRYRRTREFSIRRPWFLGTRVRYAFAAFTILFTVTMTICTVIRYVEALSNPSIASISPNSGHTSGGTLVTINGSGFTNNLGFTQVSTAYTSACGLAASGKAYCWGDNTYGQLGNNSTTQSNVPVAVNTSGVLSGKTVTQVSVGSGFACAAASGKAYCWGDNTYGQLGNNSTTQSNVPVAVNTSGVLSGKTVTQVSVGAYDACAVTSDGGVYCWGYNGSGQLGNNSTTDSLVPVAVTTSGVLSGKTVTQVSVASDSVCALASDNKVYCWGFGGSGQLGNNSTTQSNVPVAVNTSGVLSGKTVTQVDAGISSVCAVTSDGGAYCWGDGSTGQLGNNSTTDSLVPVAVTTSGVLSGKTVTKIDAGAYDACAVTSDGGAYCWGGNFGGELGNNSTTQSNVPVAVNTSGVLSGKTVTQVSIGTTNSCAITSDSGSYCWGDGSTGQLGNNSTSNSLVPVSMSTIPPAVSFGGTPASTVTYVSSTQLTALTPAHTAGAVNVVVTNSDGQSATLASGFTYAALSMSPNHGPVWGGTQVSITGSGFTNGQSFSQISSGDGFSCGIAAGKAYCWGLGGNGQLGNNTTSNSTTPVAVYTGGVLGGKTIAKISVGGRHACALTTDNILACWGRGDNGALGNNSTLQSNVPVAVVMSGALSGKTITQITTGGVLENNATAVRLFSCALASDGTAYCWGSGTNGTLGNNATSDSSVPVAVTMSGALSGKTITQISAGGGQACVIASDSNAYCWGQNDGGQLGDNSTTNRSAPVAVTTSGALSGKTITQISAGAYHTCVIGSDAAYCWGQNGTGQLGNNSTTNSQVPVAVTTSGVLSGKTITQISAGGAWGSFFPANGQYGHTCVLTADNLISCWGQNNGGQLGNNSTTQSTTPVATTMSGVLSGKTITQISAGGAENASITCALDAAGMSYCWGYGNSGQMGNGTTTSPNRVPVATTMTALAFTPPAVTFDGVSATKVRYVSSSQIVATTPSHAAGAVDVSVTNSDGSNSTTINGFTYDAIDARSNKGPTAGGTPITIKGSGFTGGQSFTQISNGSSHSCGITPDGKVYCWGLNNFGQLGNNSTTSSAIPTAVTTSGVLSGKTVVQVSAGTMMSCAVTSDGGVYCWGYNNQGQLGNNSTVNSSVPVAVTTSGVLSGKTVVQVSAGGLYASSTYYVNACALTSDGLVYCWGNGAAGQLGNNASLNSSVPVAVTTSGVLSGKTVTQISTNAQVSCAVTSDGGAYCWGAGGASALGNGSASNSSVPVAVTMTGALSGKTVAQISVGAGSVCVIASDAHPYCWGQNNQGQLGNNSTTASNVPVAVTTSGVLSGKTVTDISVNGGVSNGNDATTIRTTACVTTSDNNIYCWGANSVGQFGNNSTTNSLVPTATDMSGVLNNQTITQITSGGIYYAATYMNYICALTVNGQMFCWGDGSNGQLGNGSLAPSLTPTTTRLNVLPVTAPSITIGGVAATNVTYLSSTQLTATTPAGTAGAANMVITQPNGLSSTTVSNAFTYVAPYANPTLSSISPNSGSTAGGTSVTLSGTNIAETANFISISAGQDNGGNSGHTCGITADGRAYCWGLNGDGQLGDGTTTRSLTPVRVRGPLLSKTVVQIAAGGNVTCALTADNLLYCWGDGNNGKLGNNATSDSSTPVSVTQSGVLNGKTIRSVKAAADDICVVASDNTAACWGYNGSGRLGNNSTTASSVPVAVSGGHSFISVTPGQESTCGIRTDYTVYCWGDNTGGAVGDNSVTNRLVPTPVNTSGALAGRSMMQVTVKNAASCGLASTGKTYCWGGGWDYGLGNGSTAQSSVPVTVNMSGLTAMSLVAGFTSPCVLTDSNTIYCWGDNSYGQHGTGNTTTHTTPTQMDTATLLSGKTIAGISTASTQTCVVTLDQITACTGYNVDGALGNNSTSNSTNLVTTRNYVLPSSVALGGTPATGLSYVDQNTVTATTPAHAAGTVNAVLTRQDTNASTLTNSYTYITPATVPGAPTGLSATPLNNSVAVSWAAPASDGGSAITDYTVEYSSDGGSTWNTFSHAPSTATTQTVTGLSGGITYTFRVKAVNSVGTGAVSSTVTSQTLFITLTSSGTVGFSVTPDSSGKVSSASSTATVNTNNQAGYTLQLSMNGSGRDLANGANTIVPTSGTYSLPAALGTNTWGYRVDGIGGFGAGPTSSESSIAASAFTWAMVPAQGAPDNIKTTNSPSTNDITTIWYAMKANSTKPSGTYTNTVLYTAVTN